MATLGNVPAEAYTNTVKDSFSGNGSATAFTMSLPTVTNDVRVVVENVIQDPTVAYSVSGTTLTFTSAPPTGTNNIYVVHLGPAVMTTVPPAEIADATTFASSLTVQGAFTSVGIDDNADAVALTIDSSENVLIGMTTDAANTVGIRARSEGLLTSTRDGSQSAIFGRKTSDGDIALFQKDGGTVGSIGTAGGTLTIDGGGTSSGIYFGENQLVPRDNGAGSNNVVDLGQSGNSFKDLYLSGGVYLGGTGSVNKLDDYETGGWTPTLSASGYTFAYQASTEGRYVKIGSLVHINGYIRLSANPSGSGTTGIQITGLPFTVSPVNASSYTAGSMLVEASGSVFSGIPVPRPNASGTTMPIYQLRAGQSPLTNGVNVANITSTMEFEFQITYHTNA